MASRLQPRQKDAAKTSRSLFLWRFEAAIWRVFKLPLDTAWPKESVCSGSCNCRWAPFVLWGHGWAQRVYLLHVMKLLATFRSAEGKPGPTDPTPFVPLRAPLDPKSLSATGPETAIGFIGHLSFRWGQRAHGLYAFGSTEGTAGSVAGLETAVGHPSFRWGQGRAHGLYAFRSTEGKAGPTDSACFVPPIALVV